LGEISGTKELGREISGTKELGGEISGNLKLDSGNMSWAEMEYRVGRDRVGTDKKGT
jgi:hypothetical protein